MTMTDKLHGQQAKMADLSKALAKRGTRAVSHKKGSPEWFSRLGWRKANGLPTAFMESQAKWSVPCDMPPPGSLASALEDAQAGVAAKGLAK